MQKELQRLNDKIKELRDREHALFQEENTLRNMRDKKIEELSKENIGRCFYSKEEDKYLMVVTSPTRRWNNGFHSFFSPEEYLGLFVSDVSELDIQESWRLGDGYCDVIYTEQFEINEILNNEGSIRNEWKEITREEFEAAYRTNTEAFLAHCEKQKGSGDEPVIS